MAAAVVVRRLVRLLLLLTWLGAWGKPTDYTSRLRALGYNRREIREIQPSVARVVVRRGLPRPQSGMPESWKEEHLKKPKQSPFRPLVRATNATVTFVVRVLKVAVPASLVVVVAGGLSPLVVVGVGYLREATTKALNDLAGRRKRSAVVPPPVVQARQRQQQWLFWQQQQQQLQQQQQQQRDVAPAQQQQQRPPPPPAEVAATPPPAPAPPPALPPPSSPAQPPPRRQQLVDADEAFVLDGPDDASLRRRRK